MDTKPRTTIEVGPNREIYKAAAEFIQAVLNQYPRAAPSLKPGFKIKLETPAGTILEISGGAHTSGLILPGGIH